MLTTAFAPGEPGALIVHDRADVSGNHVPTAEPEEKEPEVGSTFISTFAATPDSSQVNTFVSEPEPLVAEIVPSVLNRKVAGFPEPEL